ncbi:MAG: hypothetical protein V1914_02755 [archaeon]
MKKIALAIGISFLTGAYCSDSIGEMRSVLHYTTKDGFAKNPYHLRIIHKNTNEGIESYILDTKTNEYWKIKDKNPRNNDTVLDKIIDYFLPF